MLTLATVTLWVATNIYLVVASRVGQGLSYAVVFTVGLALLVDMVDRSEVGQFLGYFSSSANAALLASPLIGGVAYSQLGYHAVFAMLFALVIVDFLMRLLLIKKKKAQKGEWPALYNVYGTFEDSQAQVQQSNPPFHRRNHSGSTSSLLTSSTLDRYSDTTSENRVLLGDRPGWIARASQNLPVLLLLKSPRFLAATYGIFLNYSLIASFDNVLPLFVERTFEWDSSGAGLIFLCIVLPTLTAPLVGILSDKYGARWFAGSGLILTTPFLILLRLVTNRSVPQIVLLCVLLTSIGTLLFSIPQASISIERSF
jgi:MFS family permease